MRKFTAVAALGLAAALATLAACGGDSGTSSKATTTTTLAADASPAGDIPDTQAYVPYQPSSGRYTLTVPEAWARTDTTNGALFVDKFNSARIESIAPADEPTVASVTTHDVPLLVRDGAVLHGKVANVLRKAGPAVRVAYTQNGQPDAVTGKTVPLSVERYEFWRGGTLVTITLSGAKGADNVDPWRTVTNSFAWAP